MSAGPQTEIQHLIKPWKFVRTNLFRISYKVKALVQQLELLHCVCHVFVFLSFLWLECCWRKVLWFEPVPLQSFLMLLLHLTELPLNVWWSWCRYPTFCRALLPLLLYGRPLAHALGTPFLPRTFLLPSYKYDLFSGSWHSDVQPDLSEHFGFWMGCIIRATRRSDSGHGVIPGRLPKVHFAMPFSHDRAFTLGELDYPASRS